MKKISAILIFAIIIATSTYGQFTKLGGCAALTSTFQYNNESGSEHRSGFFGPSLTGVYELSLPVHIVPSISYIIPLVHKQELATSGEVTKTYVSSVMFDLDGHYVINSLDRFEFYGLAGLDIMLVRRKTQYPVGAANFTKLVDKDNAIGLNLGAGTYIKMSETIDIYAQIKYLLSKYDQFMLNMGVLLNLQWLSKHEEPGLF